MLVIAASKFIINIGTKQGSFLFVLNKVALSFSLYFTCVLLKRFNVMSWNKMLANQNEEEANQHLIGFDAV